MLMSQPFFGVGALRSNRPIRRRLINGGDVSVVIKGVKVVGEMKNFDYSKRNDLWSNRRLVTHQWNPGRLGKMNDSWRNIKHD